MATPLDLQEQEQIDELKAFWKQYGNLITWLLVVVLGAYAAWNGWNWYERRQGLQAAAVYDALEQAAAAGDLQRGQRIFGDLKDKYAGTVYAAQGALVAAQLAYDKGQPQAARDALAWAAQEAKTDELQAIARLRLAAVLLDAKEYDAALQQLDGVKGESFRALVADRRGDVRLAQGQPDAARAAYEEAYKALPPTLEYRRLVEVKLTALGAAPQAASGVAQ